MAAALRSSLEGHAREQAEALERARVALLKKSNFEKEAAIEAAAAAAAVEQTEVIRALAAQHQVDLDAAASSKAAALQQALTRHTMQIQSLEGKHAAALEQAKEAHE